MKNLDQNTTLHVKNEELERLIVAYVKQKSVENLNQLLNHIVTRRVLVPAIVNEKTKRPEPCIIHSSSGDAYLPIYTSINHVPAEPKSHGMMNMPYLNANVLVVKGNPNLAGIAINPFTNNLVLKRELLEKIEEVEAQKKGNANPVNLTEAQYLIFERVTFEKKFLPTQFFADAETFMQKLDTRKGAFLDELFEESYQQKRMYPYLEEDFSVMLLTISERLTVARVEFPAKDIGMGVCQRAFLAWNKQSKTARYFVIEVGQDVNKLGEIDKDLKYISYGQAPVDGAELQRVIDLMSDEVGYTS